MFSLPSQKCLFNVFVVSQLRVFRMQAENLDWQPNCRRGGGWLVLVLVALGLISTCFGGQVVYPSSEIEARNAVETSVHVCQSWLSVWTPGLGSWSFRVKFFSLWPAYFHSVPSFCQFLMSPPPSLPPPAPSPRHFETFCYNCEMQD